MICSSNVWRENDVAAGGSRFFVGARAHVQAIRASRSTDSRASVQHFVISSSYTNPRILVSWSNNIAEETDQIKARQRQELVRGGGTHSRSRAWRAKSASGLCGCLSAQRKILDRPQFIAFLTPVGLTLSFEYPVQNITERKMSEAVPEPVA